MKGIISIYSQDSCLIFQEGEREGEIEGGRGERGGEGGEKRGDRGREGGEKGE